MRSNSTDKAPPVPYRSLHAGAPYRGRLFVISATLRYSTATCPACWDSRESTGLQVGAAKLGSQCNSAERH